MSGSTFDDADVGVKCPHCRASFSVRAGILRKSKSLTCHRCRKEILVKGNFDAELRKVEKATDRLRNQLKKASKTIRINL